MKLLLLGGTSDAMQLAKRLRLPGIDVIYSVAGLVRMPNVECEVAIGGFSQFGGLKSFMEQHRIDALLDATHPYAEEMTATAWAVAQELDLPYWRFHRAPWEAQADDRWQMFNGWPQLLSAAAPFKSVFLTTGQINQIAIMAFTEYGEQKQQRQLLRTAVLPIRQLPDSMNWIKAIGPFDVEAELALMRKYKIDVLISKNSGGKATEAKLIAARRLGIPVLMLARPDLPQGITVFDQQDSCADALLSRVEVAN